MDTQYKQEIDLCHFEPWTYKSWEFVITLTILTAAHSLRRVAGETAF